NGLSKTDRDAVANAIRHLRTHLKQIAVIKIEPLRGIGYQMIFLNCEPTGSNIHSWKTIKSWNENN
ncbi:MAG: hypothetical protein KBH09_13255, partial [Saprospiraceae bacterium]|nr:hypothetical protein [Saprospiraceae bacterium]